jgi:N-hydroxyarylamine O-acetyltransferase
MALAVSLEGEKYLCDVGYGGPGPKGVLSMEREKQTVGTEVFRLRSACDQELRLERLQRREWRAVMQLRDIPFVQKNFDVLNYYCATNPEVLFTRRRVVNLCTKTGSRALMDMEATIREGEMVSKIVFRDKKQLEEGLQELFGISVSLPPI